jgi:hypothetical protein
MIEGGADYDEPDQAPKGAFESPSIKPSAKQAYQECRQAEIDSALAWVSDGT